MSDSVRVTLEEDDEAESVRVYGDAGEVTASDATFRFSVSGTESDSAARSADGERERRDSNATAETRRIAPLADVPSNGTLRCEVRRGDRGREVILRRAGREVVAWRNSCPHQPEVRLDPGDGAIVRDGQLVCHEHGARFECGDGRCTAGPCRGDALDEIAVAVRDDTVYLTDDRFDSCRRLDEPEA